MPFPPPPFPHDSLGLLLKTIWKVFREKKIFCFPGGMLLSCWRKVKPNYPHPDTPPTEEYMYCFSHNKNKYFRLRLTFNISLALIGDKRTCGGKDENTQICRDKDVYFYNQIVAGTFLFQYFSLSGDKYDIASNQTLII